MGRPAISVESIRDAAPPGDEQREGSHEGHGRLDVDVLVGGMRVAAGGTEDHRRRAEILLDGKQIARIRRARHGHLAAGCGAGARGQLGHQRRAGVHLRARHDAVVELDARRLRVELRGVGHQFGEPVVELFEDGLSVLARHHLPVKLDLGVGRHAQRLALAPAARHRLGQQHGDRIGESLVERRHDQALAAAAVERLQVGEKVQQLLRGRARLAVPLAGRQERAWPLEEDVGEAEAARGGIDIQAGVLDQERGVHPGAVHPPGDGAVDAAELLVDHAFKHQIALEAHARPLQRLDRQHAGRQRPLHVDRAEPVDPAILVQAAERIDAPGGAAPRHRVHVPGQQQRTSAALAAPDRREIGPVAIVAARPVARLLGQARDISEGVELDIQPQVAQTPGQVLLAGALVAARRQVLRGDAHQFLDCGDQFAAQRIDRRDQPIFVNEHAFILRQIPGWGDVATRLTHHRQTRSRHVFVQPRIHTDYRGSKR